MQEYALLTIRVENVIMTPPSPPCSTTMIVSARSDAYTPTPCQDYESDNDYLPPAGGGGSGHPSREYVVILLVRDSQEYALPISSRDTALINLLLIGGARVTPCCKINLDYQAKLRSQAFPLPSGREVLGNCGFRGILSNFRILDNNLKNQFFLFDPIEY